MTTIYWIRHAEAEGNLYRRCHGQYDSLITENGKAQLNALRKRFEGVKIDAVYSSDLYRARRTAAALAEPRGLTINFHKGLREISLGVWEDLTWRDIERRQPELYDTFSNRTWEFDIEGGEAMLAVMERGRAALRDIIARHPNQTVAVFSHGMITRAVVTDVSGLRLGQMNSLPHGDNTSVTMLEADTGTITLKYYADNSHLGGLSTLASQSWWRDGSDKALEEGFWYREVDFRKEANIVEAYRRDAWMTIYGTLANYDADMFLHEARRHSLACPRAVVFAMNGEEIAGILQMDTEANLKPDSGHISFFYLEPHCRGKRLGVQMLGQAVSFYRSLRRSSVVLRVSDKNAHALHVYKKYGFTQFGAEPSFFGELLLLELDIKVPSI